jgi:hypothetical protein
VPAAPNSTTAIAASIPSATQNFADMRPVLSGSSLVRRSGKFESLQAPAQKIERPILAVKTINIRENLPPFSEPYAQESGRSGRTNA